ncbi:MAG TPA: FAD-dependent oxidoreductase [Longimicrobiaceae bacterium]|nr:FAD-dependent oxidoreductase [Longimicrobiaceae bacterium]
MDTAWTADGAGPRLPVAIIGAGPIGLAAAAHLLARGERPLLLEAGGEAGASIRQWAHVRLFSPWKYLVDPAARALLEPGGWRQPDGDALPTGGELLRDMLQPLAAHPAIAPHLRLNARVQSVTRVGFDKAKTEGRERAPFELAVRTPGGEERIRARAVIDASGTWSQPNPLGAGGVPVEGEAGCEQVTYGIPDVLGREHDRFAGRRVLVVGGGHSAFNAVLDLAQLNRQSPGGSVTWAVRRTDLRRMWGGEARDALPARGGLGSRLRRVVERGEVRLVTGFRAERIRRAADGLWVDADGADAIGPVDEIVVATGFRPDLAITRELRLALDPALESPVALAPLIDPNVHSCGTVYPHGAAELAHPEPGFYTVGMKSYGRAPTFLLLTGYEQVRSVVCKLVGDEAGARAVELVLPETGVCSTDLGGSSCCAADAEEEEGPSAVAGSCGVAGACGSERALVGIGAPAKGCC